MVRSASWAALERWDVCILVSLVGLFLLSRLTWVFSNPYSASYWEESYRWMAAVDLMNHPALPFFEYQADHYQGGSLVMILLTIPFFALFGESVQVFKLSALSVSTSVLVMLYLLGRRFFGRLTGVAAGLIYLAGPPLIAYYGLVVFGSHAESVLFSLVQFYLFIGLLSGRWRGAWGWLLFGFVSGLGLWFCSISGLSLAACVLTWVLLRKRIFLSEIGWSTFGGLVGLIPWFVYNFEYKFVGVFRILEMFGYGNPIDLWEQQGALEKLISFFARDLPVGLLVPYKDMVSRPVALVLMLAFGLPFALAVGLSFRRVGGFLRRAWRSEQAPGDPGESERRESEVVFVVYAVIFLTMYALSAFTIDPFIGPHAYRLFVPFSVLMLIPAAVSAARGLGHRGWIRPATAVACCLALTAASAGTLALAQRTPEDAQKIGYSRGPVVLGLLEHRKHEGDLSRVLEVARKMPTKKLRGFVLIGLGWGLETRFEKDKTIEWFREQVEQIPPGERYGVLGGVEYFTSIRMNDTQKRMQQGDPGGRYRRLLKRLAMLSEFARQEKVDIWRSHPWGGPPPAMLNEADALL
jgi:4-amino-4-deoxy-L-arabinose transferase-like glycosyltransferase